jgi:O-antigen ligase
MSERVAAAGSPVPSRPGWRRQVPVGIAAVALILATAAASFVAEGSPFLGVLPALVTVLAWVVIVTPLRWSVTGLLFLSLAVDDRSSAEGVWRTPLSFVGDLLHSNIDAVVPGASGFKLKGIEVAAVLLAAVALFRRLRGDTIDTRGDVATPRVMREFVGILLLSVGYAVANGLASGGDPQVALWHARPFLDVVALFFLFQLAYRGPVDHVLLGRTIVAAASVKAVLAIWIRAFVAPFQRGGRMEFTTNHGDSILFVVACAILLAQLFERPQRRFLRDFVLFFPLLVWGMIANARRLAWVELAFVAALFLWISPRTAFKRGVMRALVLATPLLVAYVIVGLSSDHPFFAPVATFRSVSDSTADRSTWDRHVESWNIANSIRDNPLRGRGFGQEYTEYIAMDDISHAFPMYKAEPHNMLLGLVLFAGAIAFTGIVAVYGLVVFLAARSYARTARPLDRVACLTLMAIVVIIWLQIYGDMGVFSPQAYLLGALAMALSGKMAVASGAYPAQ